jgi:expansin (peptidoglycan-binding protein)
MKIKLATFSLLLLLATFAPANCQTYTGDVTYYTEWRGNYGSCGLDRSRHDQFYVAALSRHFMGLPPGITNPNKHPMCAADKCLQVFGPRGSVVLKVSDTCWGCSNYDVDVADTVFPMLDDPWKGRVRMNWKFVDCRSNPPGRR